MTYNFGEHKEEWSVKQGKNIPVWISPKYEEAKAAAIKIIEDKTYAGHITPADFWILMNETKSGKMGYTGLIISHNGCLKINDLLPLEKRFRADCISIDKNGFGMVDRSGALHQSLVFTYCCSEQGLYEVGEVNYANCKNEYPYAMSLKRCFDRVVLKMSKLAYAGIYSDSEADEFSEAKPEGKEAKPAKAAEPTFTAATKRGEEAPPAPPTPGDEDAPAMSRDDMLATVDRLYTEQQKVTLAKTRGIASYTDMTNDELAALMERLRKAGKI